MTSPLRDIANREIDTLVLGIGNLLWADEGFGVRCVETLNERYAFQSDVRLMDGGTQGLFLLPYVQAASNLLIFDAIDFGLEPGELRVIRDSDVPQYMGAKKVSMHQTGFQEVLSAATLTGKGPTRLALVGIQPEELDDYGEGLRPAIQDRIPEAINRALQILREWGVFVEPRDCVGSHAVEHTGPEALARGNFERTTP